MNRLALTALCLFSVLALHADDVPEPAEKAPGEITATATLVGGQAIVGKLSRANFRVKTKYGVLTVPIAEVVRVYFGVEFSKERSLELKELVDTLERDGLDTEDGKKALARLPEFGEAAIPTFRRLRRTVTRDDLKKKLAETIEELDPGDEVYLDEDDEIITDRFTLRGSILDTTYRFESLLGSLEIPTSDIRTLILREEQVRAAFVVRPEHQAQSPLITKVRLKKGQRLRLEPSGTMSYSGNMFGPAGLPWWNQGNRSMGCLQWRVGKSGGWRVLGSRFDDRVPASGLIQFSVNGRRNYFSGEFRVKLESSAN